MFFRGTLPEVQSLLVVYLDESTKFTAFQETNSWHKEPIRTMCQCFKTQHYFHASDS